MVLSTAPEEISQLFPGVFKNLKAAELLRLFGLQFLDPKTQRFY